MNTTIKGMHGYDGDSVFEKKKKHDNTHEQYPWLFKG